MYVTMSFPVVIVMSRFPNVLRQLKVHKIKVNTKYEIDGKTEWKSESGVNRRRHA